MLHAPQAAGGLGNAAQRQALGRHAALSSVEQGVIAPRANRRNLHAGKHVVEKHGMLQA